MADDESEGPARPSSRGPRVVTGNTQGSTSRPRTFPGRSLGRDGADTEVSDPPSPEAPDDDVTTDTLVGPGSPAAPPTPTYQSRRPRVVTGGTVPAAEPAAPPEPGWAPPRWAEPELADSGEPTQTIPPPLHRTAAPPSDASSPIASPPKAGKPPKPAGSPSGALTREPMAAKAFLLSLLSLVLLAIPAIPALITAGRAKRRIAGHPGATGSGLVAGARIVAVIALAGWLAVAGLVVANLVRPDGVDYAELKPGDCIDTPDGTEVRRLKVRACDEPHDAEVFAVVVHPAAEGDAFPGAQALLEYAANACLGQLFTDYVGIPRGQSQLTEFEIVPESEAWHDGRRGLVCAVDNPDRSPLTAPVKGSAK